MEIFIIVFLSFVICLPIFFSARKKVKRAQILMDQGWTCIGINFITGPMMIPPIKVSRDHKKTDYKNMAELQRLEWEQNKEQTP